MMIQHRQPLHGVWMQRQGPDEPAGAYIEVKARLAQRLGFDGSRIVVEGIIHGVRGELKKTR